MIRTIVAAVGSLLIAHTGADAQLNPSDLKWGPGPAALPEGVQMAVLSGDPAKQGIFVLRLKMPAGYKIPAHNHPTDELVTVISGDLSLGMGDKLDTTKATALQAGGFAKAAAGMNHYVWTTSGAVVQVIAQGPFAATYANPADDPRLAK